MIKRMKGFRTECTKLGEGKEFYFLRVHYDREYTSWTQIRDPEKDIPKIIKSLQKALKEVKEVKEVKHNKKIKKEN